MTKPDDLDPVDDMKAALRSAMTALDLTLWSASGAHVFNGETALTDLARSLLARRVLAPTQRAGQTPCPVCPHWQELHNPDGSCGCGMDCANRLREQS